MGNWVWARAPIPFPFPIHTIFRDAHGLSSGSGRGSRTGEAGGSQATSGRSSPAGSLTPTGLAAATAAASRSGGTLTTLSGLRRNLSGFGGGPAVAAAAGSVGGFSRGGSEHGYDAMGPDDDVDDYNPAPPSFAAGLATASMAGPWAGFGAVGGKVKSGITVAVRMRPLRCGHEYGMKLGHRWAGDYDSA